MSIVELNAIASIGQDLGDETLEFQEFFLRHVMFLSVTRLMRRALSAVARRPAFALHEGNESDAARGLIRVIAAIVITAVLLTTAVWSITAVRLIPATLPARRTAALPVPLLLASPGDRAAPRVAGDPSARR